MPITPYTTPVQFEYKPLNLAAFAVPLAKMQEQFDLTQATISNTDFDISNLPYGTDPERAKELVALGRAKRDELATNLLQTKNYRQAAIKLNQLNKEWNKDPERLALEGEAKRFEKRKAEEIARIDSGKADQISQKDYDQWLRDEIRKYETRGGASFKATYENPEGTWNKFESGRGVGRLSNLEEELDKLVLDVASKVHSDSWESSLRAIGMDQETMDKHFQKSTFESLPASKVSEAVRGFLLSAPNSRFKEWGKQTAHYNFLDMYHSGDFDKYAEDIVGNALEGRGKYLDKVKGNKAEDESYQMLSEMKKTGEYDPAVVEQLYTNKHLNDLFDMSSVGNVFEYNKRGTVDTWRDVPIDDGSGNGSLLNAGKDAIITPNKFENFSVNSLNKTVIDNTGKMLPELQKVGNIAGGAARTIFLGQKGSQTRDYNSKNMGAYRDRIERGLSIFTELKNKGATNHVEFYKALNRAGITATQEDAKKLWNDLSAEGSGSLTLMQKALNNTAQAAYDLQDAKDIQKNVLEGIKKSTEVKTILDREANNQYSITGALTVPQLKKLEKLGGEVFQDAEGRTVVKATLNQMAQLNGYRNAKEAAEKGFNFYGSKVFNGKNTNEYMQEMLNKELTKKELSKRLTGNKEIDAYVNNQFLNVSDLGTFKSAFGHLDPEVFDEKGNVRPGVTLDVGGTRSAKMNFHGNSIYYETPVKIKTENGVVEKMAYLTPKTGSQAFNQRALNFATKITEGKVDELQKQTNDVAHTYSFNNRFKNTLSPQTFESTEVSKGGSIPLLTLPNVAPGANLVVKKEYPSWKSGGVTHYGQDPVMHIYINGEILDDPNTGKPFYSTNTNAVKAFLDKGISIE